MCYLYDLLGLPLAEGFATLTGRTGLARTAAIAALFGSIGSISSTGTPLLAIDTS
jgi:hypothetical protein